MNYKATKSFAMNKNDYEKVTIKLGETLPNDFASEAIINDLLEAGYIVEYDGSLEITEYGTYDVTDYDTAVVNVGESTPHVHTLSDGSTITRKYEPDVCYEVVKTCNECGETVVVETVGHNFQEVPFGGGTIERCTQCGETREDLEG